MTRRVGFDGDDEAPPGKRRAGAGRSALLALLGMALAAGGLWALVSGRILTAVALIVAGVALFTTGAASLLKRAAGIER